MCLAYFSKHDLFESIHDIAYIKFSFLLMAEQYCIVYLYHIWLLCSSINGRLVCFHLLAIVNNVAVSIGMQISVQVSPFNTFVFIYMLKSGIAESYGVVCLTVWEAMVSIPFYILTSSAWIFQFLYILSSLVLFHTFHYSKASSCEVISHCCKFLLLTSTLNWDFLNCWAETWDMWGMSWVLLLDRGTARCEGGWKMKQKHYTGAWVYKDLKSKQRFFRG